MVISLDSPVTTVLGDTKKRTKIIENLHIESVGDLLNHFPRRYLETGRLTKVSDLQVGQMLTVVGEIASSETKTYTDRRTGRPAFRLEALLRTDGPSLKMTFFAKNKGTAGWQARRLPAGQQGLFLGQASQFNGTWQLTNPRMVLFGVSGEGAGEGAGDDIATIEAIADLYPIYPLTKGVESWDLQRAVAFTRSVVHDLPDVVPASVREAYDLVDARTALDWIHAPDEMRSGARRPPALPLRGGAGHPAGPRPPSPGPARARRGGA